MPWFCAMSKPGAEAIAATNLERQGYEYYYPRIKQQKPGGSIVIEPLFRRYLFIFTDGRWYSLRSTRGVSHILTGEGGPKVVDEAIVTGLKAREGKDGLISLAIPPKFVPGQKVKLEAGPLAGQFALFESMSAHERCKVLLQWLGGQVSCVVDSSLLAAA